MKSILSLVASSPDSPGTQRALELARGLRDQGHQATLGLIQDAVLCALKSSSLASSVLLEALLQGGVKVYYLEADLALRGFSRSDVRPGLHPADYGRLVDLIEENDQTMGAF